MLTAFVFAVAGATAVALSMIASDGYLIILTGPAYLAVCGLALLVTTAVALRSLPTGVVKWLSIFGCCVTALVISSSAGLALGSLINRVFLHWPVSDHHLP